MRGGCAAEIEGSLVGGERDAERRSTASTSGASPREFFEPGADTLILSTTNGTRTILAAAERCELVLLGSLLNLSALVARQVRERGRGRRGHLRRFQRRVRARRRVLRRADRRAARSGAVGLPRSRRSWSPRRFADAHTALLARRRYGPPGLEEDILFCSRESVLQVVPRLAGMLGVGGRDRARDATASPSGGRLRSRRTGWSRRASRSPRGPGCARSSGAGTPPTRRWPRQRCCA